MYVKKALTIPIVAILPNSENPRKSEKLNIENTLMVVNMEITPDRPT